MSDPIEVAKRRYSEELAAYTLEQWRIARSSLQAARANGDSRTSSGDSDSSGNDSTGSSTSERRRSRSSEEDVQQERSRHFRAVDFAQKAPVVNGTA